jgi:hypothetical protein
MRQMASGAQNLANQPVNFLNNSFAGQASAPVPASMPVTTPGINSVAQLPPFEGAQYLEATMPGSAPSATADFTAGAGDTLGSGSYAGSSAPAAPPIEPVAPVEVSNVSPSTGPSLGGPGTGYQGNAIQIGSASNATPYTSAELQLMQGQSQGSGLQGLLDKGIAYAKDNPISTGLGAMSLYNYLNAPEPYKKPKYKSTFDASKYRGYEPTPPDPYRPQYAGGGPVEAMSNANAIGANTGYPMADIRKGAYATPYQQPISRNVLTDAADAGVNPMTGQMSSFARGGISDLGGYSDYARGGRMLKGPGDGMSDDIPATIANKQPARLANEEFVVPADVVSHLGNGSSEAGAKVLYKMMDRVRQARTGNKKQGKQINPEKYLA